MAENKEFIIQIKGLQIGKHHFEFPISGAFFKSFGNSQILDAELDAEVVVEKGSGWLNVTAYVEGDVTVECDRCLDDVVLPMDFECSMAVKFTGSIDDDEDGDEFLLMDPADGELVLDQFLYDYVCLNLPLQRVHEDGECNSGMMEKWNSISASGKSDDEVIADSPFGALKGLFDKKN